MEDNKKNHIDRFLKKYIKPSLLKVSWDVEGEIVK